jgi:glutamine synthetase
MLARAETELRALGCRVHAAYEIECHVLAEAPAALTARAPHTLQSLPEFRQMLSYVGQRGAVPLFDDLVRTAELLGIGVDSLHVEHYGLLEAALAPTGGREAADRLTLFKAMTKVLARRHGALATFMARLSDLHAPAGAHLNLSLQAENGTPLFWDTAAPDHISDVLRHFLGGLQRHLPDLFLLCAPTLNSWKRYAGPAFVGRRNTWGMDNKTAAFRVVTTDPAHTRIEIRLAGADISPHLALAAVLAAGRRGLAHRLHPSPPVTGDANLTESPAGPPLPADFAAAIRRWRAARVAAEEFGSSFVAAYAGTRDWQIARFNAAVTDWEVRQFAESL